MTEEFRFTSTRGRAYDRTTVRPIVRSLLQQRWRHYLPEDWCARIEYMLDDDIWLWPRNGSTPAALARALEPYALGIFEVGTSPFRRAAE